MVTFSTARETENYSQLNQLLLRGRCFLPWKSSSGHEKRFTSASAYLPEKTRGDRQFLGERSIIRGACKTETGH
jgi:hypothetical protein